MSTFKDDIDPLQELERAEAKAKADPRIGQLVKAARTGDVNRVRELLASGADPNQYDPFDGEDVLAPPVLVATFARKPDVVRELAKAGANLNGSGPYTALGLAAGWGHVELVRALIEGGAELNIADNCGATPLYDAVNKKHPAVITELLKAGADPHLVTPRMRERGMPYSPLEYAVNDKALLDAFVTGGAVSGDLRPMLLCGAASRGDLAEVKRLLADGADVNGKNGQGQTPLACAALFGQAKIIELLVKRRADVNAPAGKGGDTPLVSAVCSGRVNIVRAIVEAGGTEGIAAALVIAKEERLHKVTEYLLEVQSKAAPSTEAVASVKRPTGVPTFDVNDTCVLVEAPVEAVAAALKEHIAATVWDADVLGQKRKLTARCFAVFRIVGQPWSVIMRLNCDDVRQYLKPADGRALSKALNTRAIVVTSGDTSGVYQYVTFHNGDAVEILDTGSAANDADPSSIAKQFRDWYGVDLGAFPTFEVTRGSVFASSLRKLNLADVKNVLTFIRDHMTRENAFVPFFGDESGRRNERVELTIEGFGPDDIERLDYVAASPANRPR